MSPLDSLGQVLNYIQEAVAQNDCNERLTDLDKQKSWLGSWVSWWQDQPTAQTNLKTIENAFQKQLEELRPLLKKFEIYLKKSCTKNLIVQTEYADAREQIPLFYRTLHPFLMMLKRHKHKTLPPLQKKNLDRIFLDFKNMDCSKPFNFPEIEDLYRYKALIELEGAYQDSLPYSLLEKVARNYETLWAQKKEETQYKEKIKGLIERIDSRYVGEEKIRLVIRGFKALVDHLNTYHLVENTSPASLKGLLLAFYMAGVDLKKKHNWMGQFEPDQITWRKKLKTGSVLELGKTQIVLGEQLKKTRQDGKEDKTLIFACKEREDCLVMIPQNRAMFAVTSLFRNTALPLFKVLEIEPKERFALIERLYPLAVTDANVDFVMQQLDRLTLNNEQPATLCKDYAKFNSKGQFCAISKGEMISLDRRTLEDLLLIFSSNDPKRYYTYLRKSLTMRKLHGLCMDLMKAALGLDKWSIVSVFSSHSISHLEDCNAFTNAVKKFKGEVRLALLKQYSDDFLNKNDRIIAQAILHGYSELTACGQFTLEAQNQACSIFKDKIPKK